MPPPRRDEEEPFQAALRRAIERADEVRATLPDVPPKVAFELRRKAVHVLVAIVAVPMLLLLPFAVAVGAGVLGIVIISATWFIERRRMRGQLAESYNRLVHAPVADVLARTRRPGEDYPYSPVLYTLSLILIGLAVEFLGMSWTIAFAAYAILGLGDAASALVGVAYGRTKLAWNRRKSVEGLTAGFVAGFFAGVAMSAIPFAFASVPVPPLFPLVVLAGAAAGALAESLPRVEDNFVVPLSAAAVMFALATLLRLPLP